MIGWIKRLKLSYAVYNFFHKKELVHNEALFRRIGLKKKYYSPLSSQDFKGITPPQDTAYLRDLSSCALYSRLAEADRQSLDRFDEAGFAVIRNYLSAAQVDAINAEVRQLTQRGVIRESYGGKIMFAIHKSDMLWNTGSNRDLVDLLSVLLKGKAVLFQSINFRMGSQQATHSDSIHMTTFPLGGLLGVWLALEDTDAANGALHYYPGSHKLPYYLNADYNNEGGRWLIGDKLYTEYEKMIAERIQEMGLQKTVFNAQKGDLLIWHANLFHGGEEHSDKQRTRKSMVFHYFKENAICYHEITQRPALLKHFD